MATIPTNFKPGFIRANHNSSSGVVSPSLRISQSSRKITDSKRPFGYNLKHWHSSSKTAANQLAIPTPNVFYGSAKPNARRQVTVEPELVVMADPLVDALLNKLQAQNYFQDMDNNAQIELLIWFDNLVSQETDLTRTIDLGFSKNATLIPISITPFEWFDLLITNFHSDEQKLQIYGLKSIDEKKKSQINPQDLSYTRGIFFEQRFDLVASILKFLGFIEKFESFDKSHWQDRAGVDKFIHFKVDDRIYGLPIQLKPTVEAAKSFSRQIITTRIKQLDTTTSCLIPSKIDEYILWQILSGIRTKPKQDFTGDEPDITAKRKNILTLPMQEFSIEYLIKFFSGLVKLDSSICPATKLRKSASDGHSSMTISLNSSASSLQEQQVKLLNTNDYDDLKSESVKQRVFGELYIRAINPKSF
ncbi:MAG: hypothetical protein O3C63_02540 [Cyanobacteria bacterium]|nr:hypothetical protein [Cyanobacteriota bacterium]